MGGVQNGGGEVKLIDNWRKALRMFSVQAMVIAGAIQGAWVFIPPEMMASIPSEWVRVITIALLVLGVVGRLVEQPKVSQ